MIIVVWRIKSKNFEPNNFIQKFGLEPDSISEDGFNLCILETKTAQGVIEKIAKFINRYKFAFKQLREMNVASLIDIGGIVGSEDQFTFSIILRSQSLEIFSSYNIDIAISAYPGS